MIFCSELDILDDPKFLNFMKLICIMQETVDFAFFQQSSYISSLCFFRIVIVLIYFSEDFGLDGYVKLKGNITLP